MTKQALKTLKVSDQVSITFCTWFDKTYGNTYYDATVWVNKEKWIIDYKYGYNAGDVQSIDEALAVCGYKVRDVKLNRHKPYERVHTSVVEVLKRLLNKETCKVY